MARKHESAPKRPQVQEDEAAASDGGNARTESEREERKLDESLDESFPASDPPALQRAAGTGQLP